MDHDDDAWAARWWTPAFERTADGNVATMAETVLSLQVLVLMTTERFMLSSGLQLTHFTTWKGFQQVSSIICPPDNVHPERWIIINQRNKWLWLNFRDHDRIIIDDVIPNTSPPRIFRDMDMESGLSFALERTIIYCTILNTNEIDTNEHKRQGSGGMMTFVPVTPHPPTHQPTTIYNWSDLIVLNVIEHVPWEICSIFSVFLSESHSNGNLFEANSIMSCGRRIALSSLLLLLL